MSIRPSRVFTAILVFALGIGNATAAPAEKSAPTTLILACRIQGGGYAITNSTGQVLENGDGVPFAPPPRATLRITTNPASVQITDGALPHPNCATGPVLQNPTAPPNAPIEITWCEATYKLTRTDSRAYAIQSQASSVMTGGDHAGDTMQSFMVGTCTSREPPPTDQPHHHADSPPHQSPNGVHPVAPRKRPR